MLGFEHARKVTPGWASQADRAKEVYRGLAFAIFQHRLERITHESGDTLVAPRATVSMPFRGWQLATFSASGRVATWPALAAKIEQEHRRAFQFGFNPDELERARKEFIAAYDLATRTAASRPSAALAAEITGCFLWGEPFTTPQTRRDDVQDALANATERDCRRAFRESWEHGALNVFITTQSSSRIGERQVAEILNESRKVEVKPREAIKLADFAYDSFGPAGTMVKEEEVADLDLRLSEFSNGVRFNFKSTSFEADLVRFQVRVGHGWHALPESKPGLSLLAQYTLINGGLRKHPAAEVNELLMGRSLGLRFYVDVDAFCFFGYCSRQDLALTLKLVAAYCTDARFDREAMQEAEASYNTMWTSLEEAPGGPIHMISERLMFGDRHFGVPWRREFAERSLPELALYLQPELREGPVEMCIVGDVSWKEASEAVAQTLGALPKRAPRKELSGRERITFRGESKKAYVYLTPARLKQTALAWYWPVADVTDTESERRCSLLADVVADRVRVRLREELGTTYSPTAAFIARDGLPGASYLTVYAEVESSRAVQAAEIVNREMEALRTKGITEDEFLRAKQPFLRSREDDQRDNNYWCFRVLHEPQRRPELIVAARNRPTDLVAITRSEVEKMAKRYLVRKKAYFLVAEPGKPRDWKK